MKTPTTLAILTAAGALAAPTEGSGRPSVGGPLRAKVHPKTGFVTDSNWAGAVLEGNGWTSVTAETVIPTFSGQDSSAGAAGWVGIDGANCHQAILQTGVQALGDGSVAAWYEWYPEPPVYYESQFPVKGGDRLRMTVNATSPNSGSSTLENLTTGVSVHTPFNNMRESLCLTDAEWIIELGGGAQSLANFGDWSFTSASAGGSGGSSSPQGSTIYNIADDSGQVVTDCSASSSGVDCQYI
ncbi:hypothetical protein NLG97_g37 [Lecanicillium saksenae]|uniref:Uncharacterized protein n=1 Tax=Lecanicillium saksenae TaxID=468837 RepID=A0ACC1RB95_9HYPO|nr:hypothetical protein NLG97_g37 [Lecanicillium saksenae]